MSEDDNVESLSPAESGVRWVAHAVMWSSLYAPVAIFLYLCNRHRAAIKYRNPAEMAFTALAAFVGGLSRCLVTLYPDRMSCTFRLLFIGCAIIAVVVVATSDVLDRAAWQLTLLGYVLAELRIVLTFNLTELMVGYANRPRSQQLSAMSKLQRKWILFYLRRGLFSFYRVALHVTFNVPLLVLLYSHDLSAYSGETCPPLLVDHVTTLLSVNSFVVIVASFALSFKLSRVVDNFGLRQTFQACSRAFAVVFIFYVPLVAFFFDYAIVSYYRADVFLSNVVCHVIIGFHIVRPLREAFQTKHDGQGDDTLQGTAGVLDAYLHTPEGLNAFATFAKAEFMFECVLAWKNLMEFRLDVPNHPTAQDIYDQHLAPSAPLPLDNAISVSILKRFALAFEANNKYTIVPDAATHGCNYFDVLLDAVMAKILGEMLPRFLRHPLGVDWMPFLVKYHTEVALNKVLDHHHEIVDSANQSMHTMPTIKGDTRHGGRLMPIQSVVVSSARDSGGRCESPPRAAAVVSQSTTDR
ncbi:Aste57867_23556 [Aphanomyces stellatus]|uniref:Aste57867_23556 protein n=1 Tax=Aphanomyces stellatus TaxID=120398 RepID=A0A485LMZ2_9STRA|nr:hypothetical protein As57867_023485 [Aphanomyces stellatus]VFU00201.1 Aste57867_23556 [Aphanomyces stellatus]